MATRSPSRALSALSLAIALVAGSACGFTYEPDPGRAEGSGPPDAGGASPDAYAAEADQGPEPGPEPEPAADAGAYDGAPDANADALDAGAPCDPDEDAGPDAGADAGHDADPCEPAADADPPDADMQPEPEPEPI